MSSVLLIRAIVWCSPQLGHCETSSKRRRQYTQRKRPGSCVGRSQGSPQPGQAGAAADARSLRRPRLSPARSSPNHPRLRRAMKKPVVRSRSGRICRKRGSCGRGERRGEGAEVVELERRDARPRGGLEQGGDPVLVLAAGDRAGRVDEGPPGRSARGGAAQQLAPGPRPAARSSRGDLRQRASGREASVPRSEQGASRRTRSKPGAERRRGRVGLDHGDAAQAEPLAPGRRPRRPARGRARPRSPRRGPPSARRSGRS